MSPRRFQAAAAAVGLLIAAVPFLPQRPRGEFPTPGFSRLPILEGGRVKPIDSFARNTLLLVHGRQSLSFDGKTISAMQWLLDVLMLPESADTYPSFLIDDPDILGLIGLSRDGRRRFAYWQLEAHRDEINKQAIRADGVEAVRRSRFQSAVIALNRRLGLYERVKHTLTVAGTVDALAELKSFAQSSLRAQEIVGGKGPLTEEEGRALQRFTQMHGRARFIAQASAFKALPPQDGQPDDWMSSGEALLAIGEVPKPHPGLKAFATMADAYRRKDAEAFELSLLGYDEWLSKQHPNLRRRAHLEAAFNRLQPFVSAMALYLAATAILLAWWASRSPLLYAAAIGVFDAALITHTVGLAVRSFIQGRPPVTNLYSSAVFVGWTVAVMGLLAERIHRRGLALAASSVMGFCALIIAQHLGGSGDTMEMMRAVLDSNFWLTTHVITITFGYSAMFLAGGLGIAWVIRRHFARAPAGEADKALYSLAYGVISAALLFSFVGTTLGGIWADQSWGRFWGWDPKENGALLIVLWCALILHARWGGFIAERGVMIMLVFGNVVTAFSWFGVNMMGVGLHSYGFTDQSFLWLAAFVLSQLLLMLLGWLPACFWAVRR